MLRAHSALRGRHSRVGSLLLAFGYRRAELAARHCEVDAMNSGISRSFKRRNFQSRHGNSRSPVGNVLPRERFTPGDVAKGQAQVLQDVFGSLKSPAKEMAKETGLNERACRNQIAGLNSMNLADFFNACHAIPELRAWGARMMGLLADGDPSFAAEFSRGRQEIVLRLEGGNLTLDRGED
jgi:hypothetical protein